MDENWHAHKILFSKPYGKQPLSRPPWASAHAHTNTAETDTRIPSRVSPIFRNLPLSYSWTSIILSPFHRFINSVYLSYFTYTPLLSRSVCVQWSHFFGCLCSADLSFVLRKTFFTSTASLNFTSYSIPQSVLNFSLQNSFLLISMWFRHQHPDP